MQIIPGIAAILTYRLQTLQPIVDGGHISLEQCKSAPGSLEQREQLPLTAWYHSVDHNDADRMSYQCNDLTPCLPQLPCVHETACNTVNMQWDYMDLLAWDGNRVRLVVSFL
jgi:hypothetical protein